MNSKIKSTKAAILVKQRKPLLIERIELPEKLLDGQVLVKIFYSGICGSQLGEIDGIKGKDKFLPHFHIPLQSGSNRILKLMRRRYDKKLFIDGTSGCKTNSKDSFFLNVSRLTESDVLTTLLGKELELESGVTESNYITLLKTEKGAYYQGETFDGSVILGRKGGAQNPNSVELKVDGRDLDQSKYELIPGGIKLDISAGSPGDKVIEGYLIFLNDGIESRIPVNQTYSVIAKPNSAVISADKMNVVYRGVENPMTISIPGIPDNKVRARAPGLKRSRGSKYLMNPGKGKTVKIVATGTLPDGKVVSTSTSYRIKNLPNPTGTVRGEYGSFKIAKHVIIPSRKFPIRKFSLGL